MLIRQERLILLWLSWKQVNTLKKLMSRVGSYAFEVVMALMLISAYNSCLCLRLGNYSLSELDDS
jgi:hypothetical protein